jgi:hypothetical protein
MRQGSSVNLRNCLLGLAALGATFGFGFVSGLASAPLFGWTGAGTRHSQVKNHPAYLVDVGRVPAAPEPLAEKKVLSAEDLAFGEQQVARMVSDRREMRRHVQPSDPIWRYCARAFAGEAAGQRVFWDSAPPLDGYDADHRWPFGKDPGRIRVRERAAAGAARGNERSCEELWASAVYELENMRSGPAYEQLYRSALRGELTREQWVRENTVLEYLALHRSRRVFESDWRLPSKARGIPSTPSLWGAEVPDTYEAWISEYRDPSGYPWNVWGRYYDEDLEPYARAIESGR